MYQTVRYYAGRIDEWIIWNEPEFQPGDAAGQGTVTWLGTDQQFARMMEVAYRAAKRANPQAVVAFPGTSYWVDKNSGRPQFYERFLQLESGNPDAAANHDFHDAVPLNLYRAPDDLVRVHQEFADIQQRHNVTGTPIWLLELNAMPTDDTTIPCADIHARNPIQTTQAQQAAYAVQAFALAAAVGYARIGFYQMVDDNPVHPVRGVGHHPRRRHAAPGRSHAAHRGAHVFRVSQSPFVPLVRSPARWSAWPLDPTSFTPNWQIYEVASTCPTSSASPCSGMATGSACKRACRARRARHVCSTCRAIQPMARSKSVRTGASRCRPPAPTSRVTRTAYYFIGGDPVLLIEDNVPADAPVVAPRLG